MRAGARGATGRTRAGVCGAGGDQGRRVGGGRGSGSDQRRGHGTCAAPGTRRNRERRRKSSSRSSRRPPRPGRAAVKRRRRQAPPGVARRRGLKQRQIRRGPVRPRRAPGATSRPAGRPGPVRSPPGLFTGRSLPHPAAPGSGAAPRPLAPAARPVLSPKRPGASSTGPRFLCPAPEAAWERRALAPAASRAEAWPREVPRRGAAGVGSDGAGPVQHPDGGEALGSILHHPGIPQPQQVPGLPLCPPPPPPEPHQCSPQYTTRPPEHWEGAQASPSFVPLPPTTVAGTPPSPQPLTSQLSPSRVMGTTGLEGSSAPMDSGHHSSGTVLLPCARLPPLP